MSSPSNPSESLGVMAPTERTFLMDGVKWLQSTMISECTRAQKAIGMGVFV